MILTRPKGHAPGDPLPDLGLRAETADEAGHLDGLYRLVREYGVGGLLDRLSPWPAAAEIDGVPGALDPAVPPW